MSKLPNQPQIAAPGKVFERLHRFSLNYEADNQAELFTPDAVWEFPFAPEGVPRRIEGREKIRSVNSFLEDNIVYSCQGFDDSNRR